MSESLVRDRVAFKYLVNRPFRGQVLRTVQYAERERFVANRAHIVVGFATLRGESDAAFPVTVKVVPCRAGGTTQGSLRCGRFCYRIGNRVV